MCTETKLVGLEKAISVLCMILCLLSILSSGVKLSANAGFASVTVSPSDSIQAAINNATTGDTIFVRAGTYYESLEVNKSVSLVGEDRDQTIVDGQNNQFIISITADHVDIEGFTIQSAFNPNYGISMLGSKGDVISYNIVENSQQGIALTSSGNNTISGNVITGNTQWGIALISSSNNVVSGNVITANTQVGVFVYASNRNLFSGNMISGNNGGFSISFSGGNVFSGNTLVSNHAGEAVSSSTLNTFYDNNFCDPIQVDDGLRNTWDNGVEGNYWSNYTGHDRGDGIGNETYDVVVGNITSSVTAMNLDHHPLMGGFSSFDATLASEMYEISTISNSTVSDFEFIVGTETGNKIIKFNVTGAEGTVGFSRIAIPIRLMNTSVIVLVGEREIIPTWLNSQNTALNYLYLTYSHSNQTILIISSKTLDLYNQLLDKFLTLNATYYGLLGNFTTQLQTDLSGLNGTFNGLLSSYASLLGNYSKLQQSYLDLNNSYQEHLFDYSQNLENVRSLMYIFAAATAILIVITVYFSKHAHSRLTKAPEEKDRF